MGFLYYEKYNQEPSADLLCAIYYLTCFYHVTFYSSPPQTNLVLIFLVSSNIEAFAIFTSFSIWVLDLQTCSKAPMS